MGQGPLYEVQIFKIPTTIFWRFILARVNQRLNYVVLKMGFVWFWGHVVFLGLFVVIIWFCTFGFSVCFLSFLLFVCSGFLWWCWWVFWGVGGGGGWMVFLLPSPFSLGFKLDLYWKRANKHSKFTCHSQWRRSLLYPTEVISFPCWKVLFNLMCHIQNLSHIWLSLVCFLWKLKHF